MDRLTRWALISGAGALGAYKAIESAEAQFNGCPPGFCPGSLLGGANNSLPAPPTGFIYLLGADGAYLLGADGAYLLGAA